MIKNIYIYIIIYLIFSNYILQCNDMALYGSIKCFDKGLHITCKYNNIYYSKNKWIIYSRKNISISHCINTYAKKLGTCWKVYYNLLKKDENLKIHADNIYYGISSPFQLTYTVNYGHAIWDDLYSLYASIAKLGYKNEAFNLVFSTCYKKTHYINDIINVLRKYSKGKIIYLNKLQDKIILFKTLIVGSSHQCQRCITADYTLKYSREYNLTRMVRDRMYEVFGIKQKFDYPFEGVIVHNKRYSQYEINILKEIVEYYQNDEYLRLKYIDYRNISTFFEQLKLMSKTHIYISGPGTGLLNFPFISDPGVVIHLGHIHFGCPQYLEQYILEGSPHLKAIYYSPEMRMKKLNYTYIISLIERAKIYIKRNELFYIKKEENLNDIGKLYVKICKEHKNICKRLIHEYNWGYGKCRGIWAENVVYFPSLYKKIPELKYIVILYNKTINLGCKVGINHSKQKQCFN